MTPRTERYALELGETALLVSAFKPRYDSGRCSARPGAATPPSKPDCHASGRVRDDEITYFRIGGLSLSVAQIRTSDSLSIAVEPDRSEVVIIPSGELDLSSVDLLDREARELRDAGFDEIVIDLRRLHFMDSSGLRLLLGLRDDAARNGHRLTLRPGADLVQRVFAITGTRELFDWRVGRVTVPAAEPEHDHASIA